ncbi:MAG: ATP-binding protein [Burkholderiaceae bacterium]
MGSPQDQTVTTADAPLRILVVEDVEADFELLVVTLKRQGVNAVCKRVETEVAMRIALSEHAWDAIISDHHLPAFSSGDALRVQRELARDKPFLIVSGTIGEDAAVEAMRNGADDYLIKGRLARLGGALNNAIAAARTRARKRAAERELSRSQQDLQALSAHLLTAVESERSAVARDIHDEIGSGLTSLKFDLATIARLGDEQVTAKARDGTQQITALMQACERLIKELRPPVLDAGLEPALQWLVKRFGERTGIASKLHCHQRRDSLPANIELACYRTVQEALNNVMKHAKATQVTIDLVIGLHDLSLEISDNGVGFSPNQVSKPTSFGLRGLTERIKQHDGWLDVTGSSTGTSTGTTVIVSMPLPGVDSDLERTADG